MVKVINSESKIYFYIVWSAVLVTVIMTPWTNSDSLIIPKMIILFCLACFLIPSLITYFKFFNNSKLGRILAFTSALILLQLILVSFFSVAPFEQQFFGRTGRGLGFATEFSLIIVLLTSTIFVTQSGLKKLQLALLVSCLVTSTYSVLQRNGLDIFDWTTRTNGIIGTLGNPNFQASFASMALLCSLTYFRKNNFGKTLSLLSSIPLLILIYISESTQGYITALAGLSVFGLIFFWYRNKLLFVPLFFTFALSTIIAVLGMSNRGPLAQYLYKISVQSRGDFFRTSVAIANDNPFFGVGLDSLGDNYLKYINERTASGIGEFTDHSHNLFLNYAAVGGYPLALLQYFLVGIVLYSFIRSQASSKKFNTENTALFSAWICYQLQALISPANISMLTWNSIISGSLIGLYLKQLNSNSDYVNSRDNKFLLLKPFSYLLSIIGFVIFYPLYSADHMQVIANKTGNASLAIESAKSYPESVIRYSRIGQDLLRSNLLLEALDLGRSAVKFNPNAPSAWGLILVNTSAPLEERIRAKNEILRLDPFNKELKGFSISETLEK